MGALPSRIAEAILPADTSFDRNIPTGENPWQQQPKIAIPPRRPKPQHRTSTTTSIMSYFLPIPQRDSSHTHYLYPPEQILEISNILAVDLGLPPELVPKILDFAEIRSGCVRELQRELAVSSGLGIGVGGRRRGWRSGQEEEVAGSEHVEGLKEEDGEVWFLCSEEIGCVESSNDEESVASSNDNTGNGGEKERIGDQGQKVWLREIHVGTLSKDQGWSSTSPEHYGTYEHSYSWFELSLLRDGREVSNSRTSIQNNVHAGQYFKEHNNVLKSDHPLITAAREGDRVVLWVRAKYPGWRNTIRRGSIAIVTTPYPPQ